MNINGRCYESQKYIDKIYNANELELIITVRRQKTVGNDTD